jgi:hypothetical protein
VSRDYAVIDYQTMGEFIGYERLFRATDGAFLLHMSSEGIPPAKAALPDMMGGEDIGV